MNKLISLLFITVLMLALASCNLDGNYGLFQEAANSVKHEDINNFSIVGKSSSSFILSSDKGIHEYGSTEFIGTGRMAQNTIYSNGEDVVFYNDGYLDNPQGFYIYTKSNNSVVPLNNTELNDYCLAGMPYSPDGVNFSIIFKKDIVVSGKIVSTEYKIAHEAITSVYDLEVLSPEQLDASSSNKKIKGVSIIGDNKFVVSVEKTNPDKNDKPEYCLVSKESISFAESQKSMYWGAAGKVTINHEGIIEQHYNTKGNTLTTHPVTNRVTMFDDIPNHRILVIPSYSSNIYVVNYEQTDNVTMTSIPISELNSLLVISIIGVDANGQYQIMTSSSGLGIVDIDMSNKYGKLSIK